jgi:drug/metabolite transporter (DMT)-like permease
MIDTDARTPREPPLAKLAGGFAAIYFIWGSTFLAIRFAVEAMPPFMMAGARFVVAGGILLAWRMVAHRERPAIPHWAGAAAVGALLFMGGNGSVVWSEQRVPSGLTALMLATIPLWMVVLDALGGGAPLNGKVVAGVTLGLIGLALLLGPSELLGGGRVDPVGAGVLLCGSACWAAGSLASRRVDQPSSHALSAAMQMLVGGAVLFAASAAVGEFGRVGPAALEWRPLLSLVYLVLFGSVISFTAYTWLLSVASPARVATYAFVNPVVAVVLGWAVAGEPLTPRTLLASVVIVTAVATIISAREVRRAVSPAGPVKGTGLKV